MNIREKVQAFVDVMVKVHPDHFFTTDMLVHLEDYCRSFETHISRLIKPNVLAHHRHLREQYPTNRKVWSLTNRDFNRVVETFYAQYLTNTTYSKHDLGRVLGPVISSIISGHRVYRLFQSNRSIRASQQTRSEGIRT